MKKYKKLILSGVLASQAAFSPLLFAENSDDPSNQDTARNSDIVDYRFRFIVPALSDAGFEQVDSLIVNEVVQEEIIAVVEPEINEEFEDVTELVEFIITSLGFGGDDQVSIYQDGFDSAQVIVQIGATLDENGQHHWTSQEELDNNGIVSGGPGYGSLLAWSHGYNTEDGATLVGGGGNDLIEGGSGSDVLVGGTNGQIHRSGSTGQGMGDELTGNDGADTFLWRVGDDIDYGNVEVSNPLLAVDIVNDFSIGDGDSLHLASLLEGENRGTASNYLSFIQNNSDVVISIDRDGIGNGNVTQKIVLKGVTLNELKGDGDDVISNLIENGNLIVDP